MQLVTPIILLAQFAVVNVRLALTTNRAKRFRLLSDYERTTVRWEKRCK